MQAGSDFRLSDYPQTHIVEELAAIIADGKLNAEFVNVESEHSAASVVLGASAAGHALLPPPVPRASADGRGSF